MAKAMVKAMIKAEVIGIEATNPINHGSHGFRGASVRLQTFEKLTLGFSLSDISGE